MKPSTETMLDVRILQCEVKESLLDSCAPDLRLRFESEARTAGVETVTRISLKGRNRVHDYFLRHMFSFFKARKASSANVDDF